MYKPLRFVVPRSCETDAPFPRLASPSD